MDEGVNVVGWLDVGAGEGGLLGICGRRCEGVRCIQYPHTHPYPHPYLHMISEHWLAANTDEQPTDVHPNCSPF